jgi:pimeloyl-ACP methyl ester carboxylesterase
VVRVCCLVVGLALAAVAADRAWSEPSSAARLELAPCEWPNVTGRVECGTLHVQEDRERPDGRTIALFFVVARATAAPSAEPVYFFTGGPGTAASAAAAGLTGSLSALRETRDFVFIDQRGTGRSASLRCAPRTLARRMQPLFGREEAAACRDALGRGADLRLYTTADASRDVDDVRLALGHDRINLHGSSYGTRAAWEYAARFPRRARSLVLEGPVPPGFYTPLPFARGLDAALEGVLAACESDATCAGAYPALRADVARAFDRVRRAPARVIVAREGGEVSDVGAEGDLTYGEFAEAVRYRLYTAVGAADLPRLLTSAAAGDFAPIAAAGVAYRARLDRAISDGMYLSVTCAEDIPFITPEAIRTQTDGTRLADYRVRQQVEACREWPRGAAPGAAFAAPIQTPALLLVGQFDPATPIEAARHALGLLPNGTLVEVPHGGHALFGLGIDACLTAVTGDFLARGSATSLDTSCVAAAKRPPFTLR